MKKKLLPVIMIVLMIAGCKKNNDNAVPPTTPVIPAITAVGIPAGTLVTKTIGSAGGKITSADGKLDITVPAGSVSANTLFSIQPISNFCPNGRNAFRLLPAGIAFTKPVLLTFHYTEKDINGSSQELQGIAYQESSGIWYRLVSANIDTIAKTIAVNVKHFTDWTDLEALQIYPVDSTDVKVNQSLSLKIIGALTDDDLPALPLANSPTDDDLAPLPASTPFRATWFVNNISPGNTIVGKFDNPSQNDNAALYNAPSRVPSPDVVTVKAELTGIRWRSNVNGSMRTFNRVILLKQIKIVPDDFNFSVITEYKDNNITGYNGQEYFDRSTFDMNIKFINENAVITLSNIVNQNATVVPAFQLYQFGGNTSIDFTWIPGTGSKLFGYINIVGAWADKYQNNDTLLDVHFKHKDASSPGFNWVAHYPSGNISGGSEAQPLGDSTGVPDGVLMKLAPREQIFKQENGQGIYIKITPK